MRSDDHEWLPATGACLTVEEVATTMMSLRSLIDGTESDEPNRAHAVTIAYLLGDAIEREEERP